VCRKKEKAKTGEGPTQSHVSKAQTLFPNNACSKKPVGCNTGNMTLYIISESILVSRTDLYRRKWTTRQGTSPHYTQRVHEHISQVQHDRQCTYNVTM